MINPSSAGAYSLYDEDGDDVDKGNKTFEIYNLTEHMQKRAR